MLSYIAKQPILDGNQRLYAYELLFRSSQKNAFDGTDGALATKQVLAQSMLGIGLENLVGDARAFVNFGREVLLEDWHVELPKQSAVIEILETIEPDAQVVGACQRLKHEGYTLALDDFVMRPGWEQLVDIADVIKVEYGALDDAGHRKLVRKAHKRGTKMLVERVETREEFEQARSAGYDYFQGYFFAKPAIVTTRQVPALKVNCLKLMREANRPVLDFLQLERLIKSDVALTYKLLRYVNSALFAHPTEVRSLREALLFVPEDRLRRWVWLAALSAMATDKPHELLRLAMVRAWMGEGLALLAGAVSTDEAFLICLLSLLPALIDQPIGQALEHLCLPATMETILRGEGEETSRLASVYRLVRAYEMGDSTEIDWACEQLGLDTTQAMDAYVQAGQEANRTHI